MIYEVRACFCVPGGVAGSLRRVAEALRVRVPLAAGVRPEKACATDPEWISARGAYPKTHAEVVPNIARSLRAPTAFSIVK